MYLSHLPSACRHAALPSAGITVLPEGERRGSGEMRNPLLLVTGEISKVTKQNLAVVKSGDCEIKSLVQTQMMVKLIKESEGKL